MLINLGFLVVGAVEIFPLAFDFDAGLIKPPTITSPFLMFAKGLLDLRRIMAILALTAEKVMEVYRELEHFFDRHLDCLL